MKYLFIYFLFSSLVFAKELKVLTFNTWLLKPPFGIGAAEDIEERLKIMPEMLAKTGAHIIGLQEVWNNSYRDTLIKEMKKYGYESYHDKGEGFILFETGLLIFSKFSATTETLVMHFKKYTRSEEAFTSKGALKVSFHIPELGDLDFYDTHLGAVTYYSKTKEFDKKHLEYRFSQTEQLVNWIQKTNTNPISILTADMNSHYLKTAEGRHIKEFEPDYRLIVEPDFLEIGLGWKCFFPPLTEFTFEKANPYVSRGHFDTIPDETIDYIFINPSEKFKKLESKIVFKDEISKKVPRLSDHYGVLATLQY